MLNNYKNEKQKEVRRNNFKSVNKSSNNINTSCCNDIFLYPRPIFYSKDINNFSYITSVIHLIYQISPLYKYYHNKINSKNNKFSIHLHNTLVYYNNSKNIEITNDKRKIDITKLINNLYILNENFKSQYGDPVEFLQIIIKNSQNFPNFYLKNINIKDTCECSETSIFLLDKMECIFDVPVNAIFKISTENNEKIFNNKHKLIEFYSTLINKNILHKINCPLNGIDCNFNRVTRKLLIKNGKKTRPIDSRNIKEVIKLNCLTEYIFFSYQYNECNDIINNNKNLNLLHLLLMIPFEFDISTIFNFETSFNIKILYYLN